MNGIGPSLRAYTALASMAEQALIEVVVRMGELMASIDPALIHWLAASAFAVQSAQVRTCYWFTGATLHLPWFCHCLI